MQRNYPDQIEFFGVVWKFNWDKEISDYISMQKGTKEYPTAFSNERKTERNRDLLKQFECYNEKNSYLYTSRLQNNFEVIIKDGRFFFELSESLKKRLNKEGSYLDGEYVFVLTCEQPPKLLCCREKELHHSYLANGKKVLASGTLTFKDGILKGISNNSGHYKPSDKKMLLAIKALYFASQFSLETYTSHSESDIRAFSVEEIDKFNDFSKVQAIQNNNTNTIEKRVDKPLIEETRLKFAKYKYFVDLLSTPEGQTIMAKKLEEKHQQEEEDKLNGKYQY